MRKKYTSLYVTPELKNKINFISERSKISKVDLLDLVFSELFEVCCNYKFLTIEPDHLVNQRRVFFYINGQPNMHLTTKYEVKK